MSATASPSVIVAGARTPMGRLMGSLKGFSGADRGAVAIRGALDKSGVAPDQVEYVIMGQVLGAGVGQIPARQAAVKAGIPMSVPAVTVNKVCLSGLDAIALADQLIRAGEFDVIVAGGQESMTNAPHLLAKSRDGFKYGDATLADSMVVDGLWDVFTEQPMGLLTEAENSGDLAVSREEQDAFAARSHQLAAAAWEAGRSLPSDSAVVSPRTPSSWETTTGSPLRCGISTGTTSSSNTPFFQATAARWWDWAAKASCSSRVRLAPAALQPSVRLIIAWSVNWS